MATDAPQFRRLSEVRQAWLAEAKERLFADDRVRAAWVSGSVGRGEADAWADIDLHLVAPDGLDAAELSDPKACDQFGELVAWADCRHNAPLGGAMCFARYEVEGELVLVDWHVWPESWAKQTPRAFPLFQRDDVDLPPTVLDGPELVVQSERNPLPRWSREQYVIWQVCMVHIAAAFPARGHDATQMIELAGGDAGSDDTPLAQAGALRNILDRRQPLITPRLYDASVRRLELATEAAEAG